MLSIMIDRRRTVLGRDRRNRDQLAPTSPEARIRNADVDSPKRSKADCVASSTARSLETSQPIV